MRAPESEDFTETDILIKGERGPCPKPGDPPGLVDKLVSEDAVQRSADALLEGLTALTPNGKPDYRSRKDAAIAILDRIEGKPIERQQIVRVNRTAAPPMEEILSSPAASEQLARAFMASPVGRAAILAVRDESAEV